ncbi:hypothetical protein KY290_017718 [Solanum tuberosum]|uniref:F-box domain-containing protein n=1 Tax=Solanum tuberosum TaxID=4113 RepID=A0ABQ7VC45_SOLTU|nr:hypothetical protein KY285_016699 [Solanum tuberosum]KAH0761645.1 hypothetical protein KY290_017718 [Solanum tuberosum]
MAESEGDEASNLHPKRRKRTNSAQLPSTSIKDSVLMTIPILPAELFTEILLSLPVKPLLKFRSVSKSWLDLMSTPEFINTHLSKSANNEDLTHHRLMLSFNQPKYNLKDCSVSSLINGSVTEALNLEYLFIWNPSIRKFKKLPDCRDKWCSGCHSMYGFGFDEVHRDYKVVVGFHNEGYAYSFLVKVKMYSLNSNSCTSIDDFETGKICTKSGMFVNGNLLWANDIYHTSGSDIISFDLAERTWGKVQQPYHGERFLLDPGSFGK